MVKVRKVCRIITLTDVNAVSVILAVGGRASEETRSHLDRIAIRCHEYLPKRFSTLKNYVPVDQTDEADQEDGHQGDNDEVHQKEEEDRHSSLVIHHKQSGGLEHQNLEAQRECSRKYLY